MEEAKWRLSDINDKTKYCKDEYEAMIKVTSGYPNRMTGLNVLILKAAKNY